MAKIILVSKKVNATSWQLAQALRTQQHEVVLLTSYGEVPLEQDTQGIEFMAYFRRWSFLEGVRIIPGLFGLQPQILHLLLDEDRLNAAQILLSTFARSHPSCVLTTSLLDIRRGLSRRNPVRYLVEESDIITCPSIETMVQLRGLNVRALKQGRGILPPVLNLQSTEGLELSDEGEKSSFAQSLSTEDFVVIPFREMSFEPSKDSFARLRAIAQKHRVILWGSYAHWPLRERKKFASWMSEGGDERWSVTGILNPALSKILLEKSMALFLAGQELTPVEMTEYYMRAIQSSTTLVLDSRQTGLHSDLWHNGVNCWVLRHDCLLEDLTKLLTRPQWRLSGAVSNKIAEERHLMDSSVNELNRLYNRALNHLG